MIGDEEVMDTARARLILCNDDAVYNIQDALYLYAIDYIDKNEAIKRITEA